MTDTKKVHDLFEKTKGVKGANLSHLETQVGNALTEAVNHLDAESKRYGVIILINKVQEFTYEIRKLALKYPADVVKKKLAAKK